MTGIEAIAAVTGLLSVYFLTQQNIWCWPTGLISVSLAAIVFYDSFLFSDMLLHVYYIGMNIYGWIHWNRKDDASPELPVTTMSIPANVRWVVITLVLTAAWGWAMGHLELIAEWVIVNVDDSIRWANAWMDGGAPQAAYPYGDAFTTVASLTAMWFMAQKRLENWVYWFIIDIVAVSIYALKGLYLFSGQYFIFLILCAIGFRDWRKSMIGSPSD